MTEHAIVLEQLFDAPVAQLWAMWTDPEHFRRWYGPQGASVPVADLDVRVGGTRHVCMEMQSPNGAMQMWFVGEFVEVSDGRRLVYTESHSDPDGNVLTPEQLGMPAGFPTTTRVAVEFEDAGGKTRLTLTHEGVPSDSPGAAGWQMALDKLADHLAAER